MKRADEDMRDDEWQTPRPIFELASELWGPFDIDVCADDWSALCPRYFTARRSALGRAWNGRAWCNPPYSRGQVEKFLEEGRRQVLARECLRFVALPPCYPAEGWWKRVVTKPEGRKVRLDWLDYPKPFNDARRYVSKLLTVTVVDISGRLRFRHRTGQGDSARFGNSLVVFERTEA